MNEKKLAVRRYTSMESIIEAVKATWAQRIALVGDVGSGKSFVSDHADCPVRVTELTADVIEDVLNGSTVLWVFRTRELPDGAADALAQASGAALSDAVLARLYTGECYVFSSEPAIRS